jgi:glycosyltransferase involved in cell wall biosynthesis
MYKFLVHIDDFDISVFGNKIPIEKKLTSSTSVYKLKFDFFLLLSKIGELIQIDNTFSKLVIATLCKEKNVIYAAVNGNPPDGVACKFLSHSLGGFMLSGGFLGGWEFREATINIVTSEKQKIQMEKSLKLACPNITVVTPAISTYKFHLPSKKKNPIKDIKIKQFKLIYAGRLISNKGIAQLVRALNIWPFKNTQLTIVGDFEPNFFIYQSNAYHTTFHDYFNREIINKSPNVNINIHPAVASEKLKHFYWHSDCFVYPSFHEDENFGLAPREAMMCGIPSVVTDFCGLGQLFGSKGGIVKTYPTLGGVRYSLFELSKKIDCIFRWTDNEREYNKRENILFVEEECNQVKALKNLERAIEKLNEINKYSAPTGGWRSKERFERLTEKNIDFFKNVLETKDTPIPKGLYVDGTGDAGFGWYSEPCFLKAIQGIYTTIPETPKAHKNMTYRGFWRIHFVGTRVCSGRVWISRSKNYKIFKR